MLVYVLLALLLVGVVLGVLLFISASRAKGDSPARDLKRAGQEEEPSPAEVFDRAVRRSSWMPPPSI